MPFSERSGRIDIGAVLPVIGRAFAHQRLLGAGDGDQILGAHEGGELGDLRRRGGDRAADRLVIVELVEALRDRLARRELRAGGFQRILVSLQIRAANAL